MKKTGKKGITLMELTIVLALVVIVVAMVVSFTTMFSAHTKLSTARLNAINDVELVESTTAAWMSRMATLDAEVEVDNGQEVLFSTLKATVSNGEGEEDDEVYTLFFHMDEGVLKGTLPDGEALTLTTKHVKNVEYEAVLNPTGETDCLCICTVVLELPGTENGETDQNISTICINPNVGDRYTAGGVS